MQVTVTRTIQIPESVESINEIEGIILEFGRSVMSEVLSEAFDLYQRSGWQCDSCGSTSITKEGYRPLKLFTLFGRVELRRRRVLCHDCGRYTQPQDHLLKCHATAGFIEMACLSAASWPYEQASGVLEKITGSSISHEQVRRLANSEGQKAAEKIHEEAEAVLQAKETEPQLEVETLNIALDGGWTGSLDNKGGMEGKVGVVHWGSEQTGRGRRKLQGRRYAASFRGSDMLGKLCYRQAFARGIESAERSAVIGDGATWISSIASEHFPKALRILDLWHLDHNLFRAFGSVPVDESMICDRVRGYLRRGKLDEALRELQLMAYTYPESKIADFIRYLKNNASWIVDYESMKEEGYPVGSGAVEKGVDVVINRRFKGKRGMRWHRANADAIVSLRVIELNDQWDDYWQNRRAA